MQFGDMWQVVGGAGKGGIIVRMGKDTTSALEPGRLATGAMVKALEQEGGRLRYELLVGEGPASGWVSIDFQGKDLMVKVAQEPELNVADSDVGTTTAEADTDAASTTTEEDQVPEPASFSIVGTWDNWTAPQKMSWDGQCHWLNVTLGVDGEDSFQILKDGEWATKLHPDVADASTHTEHSVQGPSHDGHGLNWTIGKHPADEGAPGTQYNIRLTIDGASTKVDWVRVLSQEGQEKAEKEMTLKEAAAEGRAAWAEQEKVEREWLELAEQGEAEIAAQVDEDALQQYYQIFAEPADDELTKMNFTWQIEAAEPEQDAAAKPEVEALDKAATDDSQPMELLQTFGYAGSLDEQPPYAKFDIRDEVCMRVGGFRHGEVVRERNGRELVVVGVKPADGKLRLWFQPKDLGRPGAGAFPGCSAAALRARLSKIALQDAELLREASPKDFDAAQDQDGEEFIVCHRCQLPVGERAYAGENGVPLHGECMAQMMQQGLHKKEEARRQKQTALKKMRREEYDIGWKAERVPRNVGPATKLTGQAVRQGMCCLVLDEDSNSIGVAPTVEPATSVNLEYLSLALRVRLHDGREPLFSLDPVEATPNSMQFKRFEPAWLAGTSAGEVLFQADYHLKELSIGEHEQPVVGMKSCLDINAGEACQDWNAREWFVVRKAEVQLSQDNILMAQLRMGVEAREQVAGADGLEDVKRTRPDHPMVKYAEAFTRNFDLIAERKSVVFHLRELAKASVMAKFLVEAEADLDNAWFELAGEAKPTCLQVPQLWNERFQSQIHVEDGEIVNPQSVIDARKGTSIYGGVQFGLDKFSLAAPRAGLRATSMSIAASIRQAPGRRGFARAAISATTRLAPSVFPQSLRTAAPMARAAISATTRLAPSAFPQTLRTAAPMARAAISAQTRLAPSVFPSSLRTAAPMARAAISAQTRLAPSVFPSSLRTAAPMARAAISAQTRLAPSVFPSSLRTAAPMARTAISAQTRLAPSVFPSSLRTAAPMARAAISAQTRLAPSVFPSSLRTAAPMARAAISAQTRLAPSVFPSSLRTAAPMARAAISAQTRLAPSVFPSSLRTAAPMARAAISASTRLAPSVFPSSLRTAAPMARGVDLNLDTFDLSEPTRVEVQASTGDLDACVNIGSAFWPSIDGDFTCPLKTEDKVLLKGVFNACLSDRRADGDRFVPPETSSPYVERLRNLLKEEDAVRQSRKNHFLSKEFEPADAGPLFPSSWQSSFEIARAGKVAADTLRVRPDFKAEVSAFERLLKSVVPEFDKVTEDGTQFRVYKVGALEIRTTRELQGEEVIGMVFSVAAPGQSSAGGEEAQSAQEREVLNKVTEYVEADKDVHHRSYVVFETAQGSAIVTERLKDGAASWEENPRGLELRNSLAKVVRVADCSDAGVTVGDVKSHLAEAARCGRKEYTQDAYCRALGAGRAAESGFVRHPAAAQWQLGGRSI